MNMFFQYDKYNTYYEKKILAPVRSEILCLM